MDNETFETVNIPTVSIEDERPFLTENLEVDVLFYKERRQHRFAKFSLKMRLSHRTRCQRKYGNQCDQTSNSCMWSHDSSTIVHRTR